MLALRLRYTAYGKLSFQSFNILYFITYQLS